MRSIFRASTESDVCHTRGRLPLRAALLALVGTVVMQSAAVAQAVLPGDEPNGEYPGYWSWPAMVAQVERYQREHPDMVRVMPIGKTYEGRDILAVQITSDVGIDDPDKPELLYMAGIHPREQQPQVALMRFMDELVTGYGTDERVTRLVDTRSIWFIPVYNVDGKVHDFKNGNGTTRGANWRTTRRSVDPDSRPGIDLNRNGLVGWGGGSANPGTQTYHGPDPLSEPESQVLFDFIGSRRFRVFLDIHSTLASLVMPAHMTAADAERYNHLTRGQRIRQREPYGGGTRRAGTQAGANSHTGNGMTNTTGFYVYGVYSYVWEIGTRGFYASPEDINEHYERNVREPWFFLLEEAVHLPLKREGDFRLTNTALGDRLTPGARVEWRAEVDGDIAYGVLVSRSGAIQVTGDYRLYPLTGRGHTLNVREDVAPGTVVPLQLYVWDAERRQSVFDVTVTVEAPIVTTRDGGDDGDGDGDGQEPAEAQWQPAAVGGD